MKRRSILSTGFILTISGCADLLGGGEDGAEDSGEDGVGDGGDNDAGDEGDNNESPIDPDEVDTSSVLPEITDLPNGYERGSESEQHHSELDTKSQEEFERQGILIRHERSFTYEAKGEDFPPIISTVILIYDAIPAANRGIEEITEGPDQFETTTEEDELAAGFETLRVTFENDRGEQVSLLVYRDRNIVLYVTTLGESGEEIKKELLVNMIGDYA